MTLDHDPNTLFPLLSEHLKRLEQVAAPTHPEAALRLYDWIKANHQPGRPLHIIVVCTGNSRRSALGAVMGNAAASFLHLPELRFSSAGTTPTAFNPRTIRTLQAVGFEIEPTGDLAPPGPDGQPNPRYLVRWGPDPDQQLIEFSKALGDPSLPTSGFAALMVCDEADAGCPVVPGAAIRLSIPFHDPKSADDSSGEAAAYAFTRDTIARQLIASLRAIPGPAGSDQPQ